MGGLMGLATEPAIQTAEVQPGPNEATVTHSDSDMTIITLRCADLEMGAVRENSMAFTTLSIPEMDKLGNVGEPQLPFKSVCIAVPDDSLTLTVVNDEYYEVYVGLVYPAQAPDPDCDVETEPEFMLNPVTYSTDAFYPAEVALMVEQGRVRGVPFALVGFSPVQYNPVTGIAKLHTAIDLEVSWDGSAHFAIAENLKSKYYSDFFENTFMNWDDFSKNYADALAPAQGTQRGATGCEYLIITAPQFVDAANTLAAWKLERGIDTRVVKTTDTGTSSIAISAYIHNAYITWAPAPSYVLLIGDADHINTNYVNIHPYYGLTTGTDLWYYTIDGSDFIADLFYGRIPVDTAAQAQNYIDKIVDYETDPTYNSGYYHNITVAAYFQDSGDGYEDRRFTRTSEEVRDYLTTNQSYSVDRVYCTDSGTNPTHWNNGDYWWPVSGAPIPAELLRANGFPWNGGAADIQALVEAGCLILNHRDHGSREGWGDPFFQIPQVQALDNGELLPIVYSINCETGWFDSETDDPGYGTSTECFCEEFLRKVDGGCVCIFGATRVSYSGYNDFMCRGWYDAAWPDFDLSIGGSAPMYRMGDILNYGKWYMINHYAWGDPWALAELTSEIFHVYGDPTMEMWTAEPMTLTVSHPSSYPSGTAQVTVNVSEDNAFVSLVKSGQIVGTAYSSGGQAVIPVNPLLSGIVNVTVTKHNFRPYRGSIIVLTTPPTDITVEHWGPEFDYNVTAEARYLRGVVGEAAVNGLTSYSLGTANSNIAGNWAPGNNAQVHLGMRVWKRSQAGTETEVTQGSPVATVNRTSNGNGFQTATWVPPETVLDSTDSIVIRVYGDTTFPPATVRATFTSEQLGATLLESEQWTAQYWTRVGTVAQGGSDWFWGTPAYDNHINGFTHSFVISSRDPHRDNMLNWTASTSPDVAQYNIYRSEFGTGPFGLVGCSPSGTLSYTDTDKGIADATSWWYIVRAEDALGNEEQNTNAVQEPSTGTPYAIDLTGKPAGWVFVSYPVTVSGHIELVLNDTANGDGGTDWDVAKTWSNLQKKWLSYRKGSPADTFTEVSNTMGVWLHLTSNAGNCALTLPQTGYYPGTISISLVTGWNMVGYPSATARLGSATLPAQADRLSVWQAAAPYITDSTPGAVTLSHGNAYWVHVTTDCVWTVNP